MDDIDDLLEDEFELFGAPGGDAGPQPGTARLHLPRVLCLMHAHPERIRGILVLCG